MKDKEIKEFFDCDCGGRNHLIRASFERIVWDHDNNTFPDVSINLEFITTKGDWECDHFKDNFLIRFFKKTKWRITEALKIFFKGYIEVLDYWTPARSEGDDYSQLFGFNECRRLGQFLIDSVDKAEKFYKEESKS